MEKRATDVEFPWVISSSGETDSVKEKIDDMYVTSVNTLILSVSGDVGYEGVNVVSSNPDIVDVEGIGKDKQGNDLYSLHYVKNGESTIEVWNGSGEKIQKTIFKVHSSKYILPETVVFLYDEGKETEAVLHVDRWFLGKDNGYWLNYLDCFINDAGEVRKMKASDCEISLSQEEYNLNLEGYHYWDYKSDKPDDVFPPKVLHTLRFVTIEP